MLKDLEIRATYDSGESGVDPVAEFLEPCLAASVKYDRLSGYFSSKVIALAAQGLAKFLASNGHFRLIMSSQLSPSDFKLLSDAIDEGKSYDYLFRDVDWHSATAADLMERQHFEAMCWLLAQGRLEIKVVVHIDELEGRGGHAPIFHQKVGIFTDAAGDRISFSGSVNETVAGWKGNIEEFKVFKSWSPGTNEYVQQDELKFERYWNLQHDGAFKSIDLPHALREKMITQAPEDMPNLPRGLPQRKPAKPMIRFRDYQIRAIRSWVDARMRGILEMATGTGKTKTARGCMEKVRSLGPSIALVTAPYEHIAKQWMQELSDWSPIIVSGAHQWHDELKSAVNRRRLERIEHLVVIAVQHTASSPRFIKLFEEAANEFERRLFVGDEVHGLGARAFQAAMVEVCPLRLGLSATPERYFDEEGTEKLTSYFGGTVFSFPTAEAMKWRDPETGQPALSPYKYFPIKVSLDHDEFDEYRRLSVSLNRLRGGDESPETQQLREKLLFERAAIVKTARQKVPALLTELNDRIEPLGHALIYCHEMRQLGEVAEGLMSLDIAYQKITGEESNTPEAKYGGLSERDWILKHFGLGVTKVLLAIKCLDEGVDVPAARFGYILASSGNPREFIQRRGRLLRPSPDKEFAEVYDFVVVPPPGQLAGDDASEWRAIFAKEIRRIEEIAADALNFDDVKTFMAKIYAELGHDGR
jgi:superfamily II DNA or RNA helicase